MRRQVALWILCFGLLAQAQAGGGASPVCGASPTMNLADVERRLTAAEALWERRGPSRYGLNVIFSGVWAHFDLEVQMRGAATAQMTASQLPLPGAVLAMPSSTPAASDMARRYTVPGLFAQVTSALKTARASGGCGMLNATFDAQDGHLLSLRNDSAGVIDDEFSFTVSPLRSFN